MRLNSRLAILCLSCLSHSAAHFAYATDCEKTLAGVVPSERISESGDPRASIVSSDPRFVVEFLPEFDTIRQYSATGRLPAEAKYRLLATHGNGMAYSNSDTMQNILRYFSDTTGNYKKKSITLMSRRYEKFTLGAAEALELPFHRWGSRADHFKTPDQVAEYLARYLRQMKAETPHLPLIVFTRSSSASLFFPVLKKYPGLISGMILMSPTLPDREWVIESSRIVRERALTDSSFKINHEGLDWIDDQLLQSHWDYDTLKGVPTLILTGSDDWEMSEKERQFYRSLADHSTTVEYHDILNAQHDVFRETSLYTKREAIEALKLPIDFLYKLSH